MSHEFQFPEGNGWVGVDFDGTLAKYEDWATSGVSLGTPIALMLERVKRWLASGTEVRIVTARAASNSKNREKDIELIGNWTEMYLGKRLQVTAEKDFNMIALWDDRAVAVEPNEGLALHDAESDPLTMGEELEMAWAEGLFTEDGRA